MADAVTTITTSFNAGEVSPRLRGRVDQSLYGIAAEEMLGWLPTVSGPAVAAPGTIFAGAAGGAFIPIPFEYNVTQGYVIEARAFAFRFWTNDARIETSPGVPFEVPHYWDLADLKALYWHQSADVLYLASGFAPNNPKPLMALERTGAETFQLVEYALRNGPIDDPNNDETKTITASGVTGAVTITSNVDLFEAGDVGGLLEIEAADYSDIHSWEAGMTITAGDKCTWDARVYLAATSGRTGQNPPEHDGGTEWDGLLGTDINTKGPYGIQWTFLYSRFGLVRMTAFTDARNVTASVINRLPDSVITVATWRWAFGVFSDRRGQPETVAEWNQCLLLTKQSRSFTSTVGGYDDFGARDSSGDFQHDLAGSYKLPKPDPILWSVADSGLVQGTTKVEATADRVLTNTGVSGPPVFSVGVPSKAGSAPLRPLEADNIVFVQRARRKLLELVYSVEQNKMKTRDLTRLADHISIPGFTDMAWLREPERLIWCAMGDGTLAALTYNPDEQVQGWARRELGGGLLVGDRGLCTITDPSGERDQLWVAAHRPSDDAWFMLRMDKVWENGDDAVRAVFLDAALTYDGAAVDHGAGADHLAGKTVGVWADGKAHRDITIGEGGEWALDYPASVVTLGCHFPARLTPLPLDAGQSEGTAQGKIKRIPGLVLKLLDATGLQIRLPNYPTPMTVETRVLADTLNQADPLYSGDFRVGLIGEYTTDAQVTIERYQPGPATLLAIVYSVEVGEL
jgi:hypothetical protein